MIIVAWWYDPQDAKDHGTEIRDAPMDLGPAAKSLWLLVASSLVEALFSSIGVPWGHEELP
jgi:hypothetical protein